MAFKYVGEVLICYDCNESMTTGNRQPQLELVNKIVPREMAT